MLDLSVPTPLDYFATLVQSDEQLPLLEAAVSIAQDAWPRLDVQQVLAEVDALAAQLQRRLPPGASLVQRLHVLNRFFFEEQGFGGNRNDYYAPGNSYLNVVLESRRGIPVSLAVLWLELARELGLEADGIGFPAHFLVQARVGEGRVVIDPFTGQALGLGDLRARLDELSLEVLAGEPPADQALPLNLFLQPASARQILVRMLGNLQQLHQRQRDWHGLLPVQERLLILLPRAWAEYRNRGLVLAELGEHERARADLQLYLQHEQQAPDRAEMQARLDAL